MKKNILWLLWGLILSSYCYSSEIEFIDVQYPTSSSDALNLGVAVTDNYMVISARGGFQPNVYYKPIEYSGRVWYIAIHKESEDDLGKFIWANYSLKKGLPDSVYVDSNNKFIALPGEGNMGTKLPQNLEKLSKGTFTATLSPNSARRLQEDAIIAPLSAFDIIAKDLIAISFQFTESKDINFAVLTISKDFIKKREVTELLPLMQALKDAGFKYVSWSIHDNLNSELDLKKTSQKIYKGLYLPLGLKFPRFVDSNGQQTLDNPQRETHKLLTATIGAASSYDLMKNQKFTKDIDQVLKDVAGLKTTGKTLLDGRRGKADGDFNEGYAEGGSGGIATKAKGSIKTPSERDIDMGAGGGSRSAADIMKVVRQRTPGLRHIYNKFLKKKPGFQGKVTLKFTIAPGGEVISISIASSTTGYGEFDGKIKNAVSRWKFGKVKSGNTTVTIPFTFSE
ncbi:TonB family C-terminal domain-containing protein [Fibrobacter intestinalis]|uniref:TonB family C-terminal domain-containing protein n=1 Tax=Fibrobacter intestinalis TaxID=28122 RepID=A0A1M6Z4K6_9BACT|nr:MULTISPECIES: AgmX/PglI C-terminal domain-containing protein [Fibrobacteraceae]MDY5029135.1 AgmX/PglI C-terminal domain-containing protein [Hallerella succinigenes]SHL25448.1 TonB family C-terminal domain-containing protein [Fibrobacter intestinalis]